MSGKYLKCFQIFWNHVPMLGKQLKTNSRPQYVVPTKSQEIFATWVLAEDTISNCDGKTL